MLPPLPSSDSVTVVLSNLTRPRDGIKDGEAQTPAGRRLQASLDRGRAKPVKGSSKKDWQLAPVRMLSSFAYTNGL